jgi:hypothetical protein
MHMDAQQVHTWGHVFHDVGEHADAAHTRQPKPVSTQRMAQTPGSLLGASTCDACYTAIL